MKSWIYFSNDRTVSGSILIFVIAHRLSTIVRADKIVVMENGEIKEMGTHSELIAMNGIYKNLYDIQFNENVWYEKIVRY